LPPLANLFPGSNSLVGNLVDFLLKLRVCRLLIATQQYHNRLCLENRKIPDLVSTQPAASVRNCIHEHGNKQFLYRLKFGEARSLRCR